MIRLLVLLTALCLADVTSAQAASSYERPAAIMQQARGVSLDQAVAMVQARYNAKVMKANSVEEGGRVVHYIRLMSQDRSRVWTVRIDAATGQEF